MDKKEYIEREEAVRAAKDGADEWDGGCSRYRDASIESAMNAIPAADVVEVKHGRWVNIVHAIVDTTGYCDKCNSQSVWRTRDMAYEICPRCGARMDKEEDT